MQLGNARYDMATEYQTASYERREELESALETASNNFRSCYLDINNGRIGARICPKCGVVFVQV